ncbi:MAG: hypothetical protein ACYDHX_07875 [Methanothrix sp.]
MQIFWVRSETIGDCWGPYTSKPLAERVQKIACMAGHEDAEVAVMECDEDLGKIMAGLLPWLIVAELEDGKLQKTSCSLTWPPEAQEGIIRGEADDTGEANQVEYFAWAKTETDAKRKLAQLGASTTKAVAEVA